MVEDPFLPSKWRWGGTVPKPIPHEFCNGLPAEDNTAVACLHKTKQNTLLAGGEVNEAGGDPITGLARWQGMEWEDENQPWAATAETFFAEWDHLPVILIGVRQVFQRVSPDGWVQLGLNMANDMMYRQILFNHHGVLLAAGQYYSGFGHWPIMRYYEPTDEWINLEDSLLYGAGGYPTVFALIHPPETSPSTHLLIAGGSFDLDGHYKNIAVWDSELLPASPWRALYADDWQASSLDGPVRALCIWRGELYAAGAFTYTFDGNVLLNGIARWDANAHAWQPLENGLPYVPTTYPLTMCVWNDTLIVGGTFRPDPDVMTDTRWGIARWNGMEWDNMQGGMRGDTPSSHHVLCVYPG